MAAVFMDCALYTFSWRSTYSCSVASVTFAYFSDGACNTEEKCHGVRKGEGMGCGWWRGRGFIFEEK